MPPTAQTQTVAPVSAVAPPSPVPVGAPSMNPVAGAEPEKKSHKVLWLVIILVLLILIGVGVFYFV